MKKLLLASCLVLAGLVPAKVAEPPLDLPTLPMPMPVVPTVEHGWEKEFCLRKGELPPQELKKCIAFWWCVTDREAGKVKHCYENDRRWR